MLEWVGLNLGGEVASRRSTLTPLPLTSALTPLPPSPVEPGEGGLSRERQQIRHCFLAFRWERTSWR
jgi:hypothetical protein